MIIQHPLIVKCDIKGCSEEAAVDVQPRVDKKILIGWNFYTYSDGKSLRIKHVCPKHDLFKNGENERKGGTLNGS